MTTHFSTVPVELAREKAVNNRTELPLPLVLVVDDEPLIAETLAAILNASGVAALTAPDGKAALEIIEVMPPDMLITDIAMPGVNGLDLAIEVARMVADCEIILFSGQAATAEMLAALRSAGRDFVTMTKPVHPSDLLARVFERLGGRVDPSAALHARSKFD